MREPFQIFSEQRGARPLAIGGDDAQTLLIIHQKRKAELKALEDQYKKHKQEIMDNYRPMVEPFTQKHARYKKDDFLVFEQDDQREVWVVRGSRILVKEYDYLHIQYLIQCVEGEYLGAKRRFLPTPAGHDITRLEGDNLGKFIRESEFMNSLDILRKAGFHPKAYTSLMCEDTFFLASKEEAKRAHQMFEKELGTIVGWWYGIEELESTMEWYKKEVGHYPVLRRLSGGEFISKGEYQP